jgi:hypothetical protein
VGTPSARPKARSFRNVIAIAATVALAFGATAISATAASAAPTEGAISGASFTWGLSGEAGGGAYAGGCNFLSAGAAGSTGSSRVWTEADGFYSAQSGNVAIVKPDSAGVNQPATFANKCLSPAGTPVSPASVTSLTKNAVVFSNGTGTVAANGSQVINWTGSFTAAFYGGMTYWTATNPILTLDASGNGTLTATASGYGADMADATQWTAIPGRTITLATISGAAADNTGFTVTPAYLGVAVTTVGTPQSTTPAAWGSFPQSYIDFQNLTGQSSYWYSSGGSRDAAKPATPLTVAYTVTGAPVEEPADGEQDIDVTVPTVAAPPTGTFGWSFASTDAVSLGTAIQAGSTFTATGALNTISVTDTRSGGAATYGWSISGQVSNFTSGAKSFTAGYLGWTPSLVTPATGVTAGSPVTSTVSGGAGLGTSATLATSTAAASADINAGLSLVIPTSTTSGDYIATLTVTALS